MTCLHPNPILSSLLLQAVEHLRLQWRSIGLAGDPFLESAELRPRLERLNARHLHRILGQIMQLCEDTASCKALAAVLQRQMLKPQEEPALASLVLELSPLLVSVPVMQRTPQPVPRADSLFSLPLVSTDLSIRTTNALRRNGFHQLGDLAAIDEERLRQCRNIGATSIAELNSLLEGFGLSLPFDAEIAQAIPSPEAPIASAPPQRTPELDLPVVDDSINRRWCEQAADCIRQQMATTPPLALLHTLNGLCDPEPQVLAHRREELHQLGGILQEIHTIGTSLGTESVIAAAEILQRKVLERYAQKFSGVFPAGAWLRELVLAAKRSAAVSMLLQHASGMTLERIGALREPAITREAVRQNIKSVEILCACTSQQFREEVRRTLEQRNGEQRDHLLRHWIATHGRLPHGTDSALADLDAAQADAWEPLLVVASACLQQRLETYSALGMAVPEAEWDLHFEVICQRGRLVGPGYWHTIEPLKHFLPRFAAAQGDPGRMPLQIELPPAVHSAVTRHGGQGPVAEAVGLRYQGQLMGQGCRRFWTDERLAQLLQHTAEYHRLPAGAMPSRAEIRRFMTSGARPEYTGKRPETVFLALKGYAHMRWEDVAVKFGRLRSHER